MVANEHRWVAEQAAWCECQQCGALQHLPQPQRPAQLSCNRCGHSLHSYRPGWVARCLALTLGGLLLFLLSNTFPFLSLQLGGVTQQMSMLSGAGMVWQEQQWILALLVFGTIFLFPLLELLCLIYVLLPMCLQLRLPARIPALKLMQWLGRWNMLEVFMLGALVSAVKLSDMADLQAGIAFYTFFAMIIVLLAAQRQLNLQDLWSHIQPYNHFRTIAEDRPSAAGATAEYIACDCCQARVSRKLFQQYGRCPRCHSKLSARTPGSLQKTLALLLAAAVLYVPANAYPIMITEGVGGISRDTILSGVRYLASGDTWPLALVVFVASVLVPISKILILGYLWWSARWHGGARTIHQRMRLYRLTELVGHWSMVDVYVVILMVALVQFGALANIAAGPAAIAFGGVVILTMLAADSFDSRLMWDALHHDNT